MKDKINKLFGFRGTIFMLHRVEEENPVKLFSNENMKISPNNLDLKIKELLKNNFTFISIDELYYNLKNNIKSEKCIVFTLDDGYLDNYTNAFPIFNNYNIPFIIYVTTSFPDSEFTMWWYALEDIILNSKISITFRLKEYDCSSMKSKENTFLQIRNLLVKSRFPNHVFLEDFNLYLNNINLENYNKLAMNWDSLRNISKEKLVTIGSHTISHPSLNFLNNGELNFEIIQSKFLLENKLDIKIDHFAYPFGSKVEVSDKILKEFKKFNFKTCVTTRNSNIYSKHANKMTGLPRVMLTNEFDVTKTNNFNLFKFFIN